jgi:hypothetical protein
MINSARVDHLRFLAITIVMFRVTVTSPFVRRIADTVIAQPSAPLDQRQPDRSTILIMDPVANAPQELVVDGPLADELERRGVHVRAGDRVRVQVMHDQERTDERTAAWDAFAGSFRSGEPDLAERSEEILRAELGR